MNNNITPAHITYEQAVWLKSIGFDAICRSIFLNGIKANTESLYRNSFNAELILTAPEQSVIVEWLRVNFGVWISVKMSQTESEYSYQGCIQQLNKENVSASDFETPQEAYSAALSYLMSNEIIKQK